MIVTVNKPVDIEVSTIVVDSHIRYFDDCDILKDGVWHTDDEDEPQMPCMEPVNMGGYTETRWRPIIDIDSGQILNWTKGIKAHTYYKVCDEFECSVLTKSGEAIIKYEGYVPEFMAIDDRGYGDYIYLTIDENGYIRNWKFCQADIESMEKYNIN